MLEPKYEIIERRKIEENLQMFSVEDLDEITALDCRFSLQRRTERETSSQTAPMLGSFDLYSLMDRSDEFKNRLLNLFREFCIVLGKANETADHAKRSINSGRKGREEEMKWMNNNKDLLAQLAGKWIAIEGNSLVAASEEFTKVLEESRKQGIIVPFIVYLAEPTKNSTIGL